MTPLPIAVVREHIGLSVPALAAAIGIGEPWCWDLLSYEDELASTLSLRQLLRAAAALRTSPLSLLPVPVAPTGKQHSLVELAERITRFCSERGITTEQFGDLAGWDVEGMLAAPDTALDDWCLECLQDVCSTLGLHWPDFLLTPHSST